jgi:hypothetical protein
MMTTRPSRHPIRPGTGMVNPFSPPSVFRQHTVVDIAGTDVDDHHKTPASWRQQLDLKGEDHDYDSNLFF